MVFYFICRVNSDPSHHSNNRLAKRSRESNLILCFISHLLHLWPGLLGYAWTLTTQPLVTMSSNGGRQFSIRWVIRLDRWHLCCSTAMKSTFISFVLPMHILLMRRLSSIFLSHFLHCPWCFSPELYSPNETT